MVEKRVPEIGSRLGSRPCRAADLLRRTALNADGVPTPTATRGEARGLVTGPGKWHAATVAKLCLNLHVLAAAQRPERRQKESRSWSLGLLTSRRFSHG